MKSDHYRLDEKSENRKLDTSNGHSEMVDIQLDGERNKFDNSPKTPDDTTKKASIKEGLSDQKIPKFDLNPDRFGSIKLQLPEEQKNSLEFKTGPLRIDFSNDPVMKSLLETKQDHCAMRLQSLYLSKNCKFLYIILAFVCSILVLWALLDSKALKENLFFIIVELLVNLVVVLDIFFKIYLAG